MAQPKPRPSLFSIPALMSRYSIFQEGVSKVKGDSDHFVRVVLAKVRKGSHKDKKIKIRLNLRLIPVEIVQIIPECLMDIAPGDRSRPVCSSLSPCCSALGHRTDPAGLRLWACWIPVRSRPLGSDKRLGDIGKKEQQYFSPFILLYFILFFAFRSCLPSMVTFPSLVPPSDLWYLLTSPASLPLQLRPEAGMLSFLSLISGLPYSCCFTSPQECSISG